MVIVTTAVYWRLSSPPRPEELTGPLNVPAPGRRQSIYIELLLRMDLCLVNSRFPLVSAAIPRSTSVLLHVSGPPSPEVTGVICRVP